MLRHTRLFSNKKTETDEKDRNNFAADISLNNGFGAACNAI